ncbi:polymer-forming cytoskeletal protein [Leptolyngbya sp. 15MV]|nr:polymer-forming cytoskeletal protein [Leptolyngbya sp. 15MV]
MASGSFSVIGADVTIRGDVTAATELHVDGNIEGDLQCASLVQGEGSVIQGAVVADSARLSGRVVGSIEAKELVVLRSARIEGDVHYDALTIEQGAEVDGRFAHRVPGKPRAVDTGSPVADAPDGEPRLTLAT